MDDGHCEWCDEMTPDEAKAKVEAEPNKFAGYVVDAEDEDELLMLNGTVHNYQLGRRYGNRVHLQNRYPIKSVARDAEPEDFVFNEDDI